MAPVFRRAQSARETGADQQQEHNMRIVKALGLAALFLAVPASVTAAEPWDPGGALDACLTAATRERQGIVTAWRQAGGGERPPYAVSVLNVEGKIAEAFCDPANMSALEFKDKGGLYRYEMYQRAKIQETQARAFAPTMFVGPVRLFAMDYAVSFTGKPYYTYQMFLPSGHKATVEIDGTVGRLNKAEIK
jgi:hypothetical protein